MNYISKLCSLENQGDKEGRKFILDYFSKKGNIHRKLKVIHVTGTCGKGSTSSMIAKGLEDAGFKVGLFTSPHLFKLNERISINGENISDLNLNNLIEKYMKEFPTLSFSTYLTLISVDYFLSQEVDYVVYEVFVGGKYDPTNIFDSIATVITSIGLDHTHILGDTKEKILEDKLGILRNDKPLFIRFENDIVRENIEKVNARLNVVDRLCETNLKGNFQKENAGLAYEVLKYLKVDEKSISISLMNVNWKGRIEYINDNIIVDSAHNELGFENLWDYINSLNQKDVYVLFAMSRNKEFNNFRKYMNKAKEIVYTKPDIFKILDPKEYVFGEKIILDPKEAFDYLKGKLEEDDILVVCGSVFLASEILKLNSN